MNYIIKSHKLKQEKAFEDKEKCMEFREDLKELQKNMRKYTALLAQIAEVEDITELIAF